MFITILIFLNRKNAYTFDVEIICKFPLINDVFFSVTKTIKKENLCVIQLPQCIHVFLEAMIIT